MTIELGTALHVEAETFGEAGQRTFRLRVAGETGESAGLWMEKQQFIALSLAFGQVLSQIRHPEAAAGPAPYEFPQSLDHEFKVGRMAVGLDATDRTIGLYTYDIVVEEEDADPTLRVKLTLDQCAALRPQLEDIVSRGRPLCPLCQQPIEETGHACIRSNGHSLAPVPSEDEGPDADAGP